MARFSSDADLLGYEPSVFEELVFAGQRTVRANDATVTGATVSSATGGFSALEPGDVVVIRESVGKAVSAAVDAVADDQTLLLSGPVVGFSAGATLVVEGRTLKRQAELVNEELLRAVGIDADDEESVGVEAVVSVNVMKHLEALGTLARAYGGAVTVGNEDRVVEAKAGVYQRRFAAALREAKVLVDLDGDGVADTWRIPGVMRLRRA